MEIIVSPTRHDEQATSGGILDLSAFASQVLNEIAAQMLRQQYNIDFEHNIGYKVCQDKK